MFMDRHAVALSLRDAYWLICPQQEGEGILKNLSLSFLPVPACSPQMKGKKSLGGRTETEEEPKTVQQHLINRFLSPLQTFSQDVHPHF